ncbi:hypothetical protein SAMN05216368_10926 [Cryobacterium flavum]|uniref:DUF927 domain-containing protein n=1 Tax=Cryobacterium flavum TaxID=1424659 RepID=A0A4R8V2R0_9MICO|nr:hypothetical protein [Cryobacterium flavum]TFB76096.1 hypothetical protein E3O21_11620 [Cryobacterium flavum]SDO00650.1 hypothetical protein SAMN05216368_10926 [Cryobacterium flavum]
MESAELATAASVLITEGHKVLAAHVETVLIVAGATSWEMAVEANVVGTVIAGIQSPAEWVSQVTKAPHRELEVLVRRDRKSNVVLALGATETDSEVFDQAKALAAHLLRIGAASVKFIKLDFFTLDAMLASRPESEQGPYLEALIADAADKLGARPKATVAEKVAPASIAPTVDTEMGRTYIPRGDAPPLVIMEAAARRLRTHSVIDDLRDPRGINAEFTHDLEISVMTASGLGVYEVPGVRDADLVLPRKWLNRIPQGTSIVVATDAWIGKAIDASIRAHRADEVIESPVLKRTGWKQVDGTWGFLTTSGFMTSQGLTNRAHSQLATAYNMIALNDLSGLTIDDERAAAANTQAIAAELTDTNFWAGVWGPTIWSAAGMGVGAVPFVAGHHGCGKTTMVQGLTAHISAAFAPSGKPMGIIDGSVPNVGRMGAGLDGLIVAIDDSRKRTSTHGNEDQEKALERLVRAGYGGGSARHSVSMKNTQTGEWELGVPDLSSPTVVMVGEQIPDAEELDSSRERLYPIVIEPGFNIFRSGNSEVYESLANSGLPAIALAAFIRWVAARIEEEGMDAWRARWAKSRVAAIALLEDLPVSRRVREVAALVTAGNLIWFEYLRHLAVITVEEQKVLVLAVHHAVRKTALFHGTTNVTRGEKPSWESLLDALRAAVAGSQAYVQIDKAAPIKDTEGLVIAFDERKKLLGVRRAGRGDNVEFLAFQARDAAAILRMEPRYRTITDQAIITAFAPVAIVDSGHKQKVVRINSLNVKCIAVPWSTFAPTETEGE